MLGEGIVQPAGCSNVRAAMMMIGCGGGAVFVVVVCCCCSSGDDDRDIIGCCCSRRRAMIGQNSVTTASPGCYQHLLVKRGLLSML